MSTLMLKRCVAVLSVVAVWAAAAVAVAAAQSGGDCYAGLVVGPGESCTYPGTTQEFWVDDSGRGYFIFSTAGTGIDMRDTTINGVTYNFKASKQADGTWLIEIAGTTTTTTVASTRFPDVAPDHYAFEAVEWAAEVGVTTGYTDGTFKPERPLIKRHAVVFMERYYDEILQAEESEDFTRGDMMVLLKAINDGTIRGTESDTAAESPSEQGASQRFPDVAPDHYAFEAVEWVAEVGVTTGYTDGTFKPERPLIKRHAVVFMERYYDEILQAEESEDFTRGDMMVLLKAINDGALAGASGHVIPTHWGTVASIYNDNVFVLPVSEDLASVVDLPLRDYAGFFYENFEDEFDFLIFVRNLVSGAEVRNIPYSYTAVTNEVRGIGQPIFSDATRWGSSGRLQGSVFLTWVEFADLVWGEEWRLFRTGPILHELMHRWANNVLPTSFGGHWGFSSAAGVVGGFDITNLADRGGGQYTAGSLWGVAGPNKPAHFSSIELYLAGFIPPEEVPDLWVAKDGEWLYDEGRQVLTDNEPVFTAGQFSVYTIEDLIAEHGPRIPNASQSQKDFRAAVILLTDEKHAADPQVLKKLSDDVSWFSHAGVSGTDDRYLGTDVYNFYEGTGGRGTITMDDLSEFRR